MLRPGFRVVLAAALLVSASSVTTASASQSQEIFVAAASDLQFAMKEIVQDFETGTGHKVKLSLGSSGHFYAQITNGAPVDLYLSADAYYPRRLHDAGLVLAGSLARYAIGQLVVWLPSSSSLDLDLLGMETLLDTSVRKIAIANWRHAPYGVAALAALRHHGIYQRVEDKLVLGENVSQAAHFVRSGAADAGILPLSLAISEPMRRAGTHWQVPPSSHPRMDQEMVILEAAKRRGTLPGAKALHEWIRAERGRAVLERHGFLLPERS